MEENSPIQIQSYESTDLQMMMKTRLIVLHDVYITYYIQLPGLMNLWMVMMNLSQNQMY